MVCDAISAETYQRRHEWCHRGTTFISRSNLNCRALFEDREGNRWWSTSNDGLRRFRPRQLELVTDRGNLPANIVRAVAADPVEGVWALIGRGLVRVTNDVTGEATLLTNQVPYARSLWIDRDGTIWIGQDQIGVSTFPGGIRSVRQSKHPRCADAAVLRLVSGCAG